MGLNDVRDTLRPRKDGCGKAVKPVQAMDMDDVERREPPSKVACHGPGCAVPLGIRDRVEMYKGTLPINRTADWNVEDAVSVDVCCHDLGVVSAP